VPQVSILRPGKAHKPFLRNSPTKIKPRQR